MECPETPGTPLHTKISSENTGTAVCPASILAYFRQKRSWASVYKQFNCCMAVPISKRIAKIQQKRVWNVLKPPENPRHSLKLLENSRKASESFWSTYETPLKTLERNWNHLKRLWNFWKTPGTPLNNLKHPWILGTPLVSPKTPKKPLEILWNAPESLTIPSMPMKPSGTPWKPPATPLKRYTNHQKCPWNSLRSIEHLWKSCNAPKKIWNTPEIPWKPGPPLEPYGTH